MAHIGYLLQVHLHNTIDQILIVATTPDNPHATIMKTGTYAVSLDLNPNLKNITAEVVMTPADAIPGHTTGIPDDIAEVVYDAHTQPLTHIILTATIHIADHLDIEALQFTPGITADHALKQPTNPPRRPHTNLHHIPANNKVKYIPREIQKLQ